MAGQRVDAPDLVTRCDLCQAQLRKVGPLAHELGVDGELLDFPQVIDQAVRLVNKMKSGH